jgi:nitrite reductase (cytochrome c-552)
MKNIREVLQRNLKVWILLVSTIVLIFLLGMLAASIITRKGEYQIAYKSDHKLSNFEPRNEKWADFFPRQYESYMKTKHTSYKSKYNGAALIDMLEVDPRLVILWAGYGFSKDYNQGRGHYFSITDINNTLRTGGPTGKNDGPMPSTCWTCKSSDVPRMMNKVGISELYKGKWSSKGHEIVNQIGCRDCHNPKNMQLTITRPALVEAYSRMGKDIKKATHQEMRSLVCAQCHVEYYFKKPGTYLTFPWDNGLSVEDMEMYYDKINFKDWTHKLSKAPMLKAQHPGYEVFLTGIHSRRGISCSDCHMPYRTEGGLKFTDHHIQSPVNNISSSCQVCHRESEKVLKNNIYSNQDKIIKNRDKLEELLVRAHVEAKYAWDNGAKKHQMDSILNQIRKAQWRWDYAAAGHGGSFHSPLEISRIIATGITVIQEARINLARLLISLGKNQKIQYPDISTKAKAQKYIGLNMKKLKKEKHIFLKNIFPKWIAEAKKRESQWNQKN